MKPVQWPPHVPPRLKKSLAQFTFYKDGVVRWYKGASRHVCGKRVPLDKIPDAWDAIRSRIDSKSESAKHLGGHNFLTAADKFLDWLDHRVKTGNPDPLSETTRIDYEKTITSFGSVVVHDGKSLVGTVLLNDIGPDEFTAFAKKIASHAPSTLARHFAYLNAFFSFCVESNLMGKPPKMGSYFARPTLQKHRDVRLKQRKSLTPQQIQMLYFYGTLEEKVWLLMGVFGAMDNSDLAHITHDVIDRKFGIIDYRRRKTGLMPRVIPVPEDFWPVFDLYKRPDPAKPEYGDLVFLTPRGLPLARVVRSKSGKPHRLDYVAMCWSRLMRRAGLRAAATRIYMCRECGLAKEDLTCKCGSRVWRKREISKGSGGDRKGFRSLRTTFSNFAPPKSRDEVEIIMGHGGGILVENYLEEYGTTALRDVVNHVWKTSLSLDTTRERRD